MTISVIVPVFNAAAALSQVVESLLQQDFPEHEYEIYLIDNGSTDSSVEIVDHYPRVRLLTETREGPYAARNRAIEQASGDLLAFTDSDCVVDRGWLRAIASGFNKPGVEVLLGRTRPPRESGLMARIADYENDKAHYVCQVGHARQQYAFTNNMAVRREAWREFGPFVETMRGADVIFVRRVADQRPRGAITYAPDMIVKHLEWTGLHAYCRKMYTYGRSLQKYRRVIPAEPLTLDDRIRVFLRAAQRNAYTTSDAVALTLALTCGLAAWAVGESQGKRAERGHVRPSPADASVAEPALPTAAATKPERVSVVLEWENTILGEQERACTMVRTLVRQIRDLSGSCLLAPTEVLIAFGQDHVDGAELEAVVAPFFRGTEDLICRALVSCPESKYYELKNAAARAATGDVVVFLDSDTIPEDGWLDSLLRPLGDSSIASVCGCSYIEPAGLWGKAFASLWFFPLRVESRKLEPAKSIFANNFAVRREVFGRYPFRPVPGTSRGACILWHETLLNDGIAVVQSFGARTGHPPPAGLSHFVVRALTHGRDFVLQAQYQRRSLEAGAFGTLGRFALNLVRSTLNVFSRRRAIGLEVWQVPLALAVAYAYYGTYFTGEILTHLFPAWMIRRFHI